MNGRAKVAFPRFSRRGLAFHTDLFFKAKADYISLKNGTLHRWLEEARRHPEMRDDPFTIAVAARYQQDFDAEMSGIQERLVTAILHACRAARLRFVSLEQSNLIGFEGVEVPRLSSSWKSPAARVVAEQLAIYSGCANSGQAQVNLRLLSDDRFGVYDLRAKPFKKIGAPLSFGNMRLRVVDEPFDTENMDVHLLRCAGGDVSSAARQHPSK